MKKFLGKLERVLRGGEALLLYFQVVYFAFVGEKGKFSISLGEGSILISRGALFQ